MFSGVKLIYSIDVLVLFSAILLVARKQKTLKPPLFSTLTGRLFTLLLLSKTFVTKTIANNSSEQTDQKDG